MTAPRIETERLVLRGFQESDLDPHAEMSADPEVMRYVGGVVDRERSWRDMAQHLGHWELRGYGHWALERKADGVMIGRAGLWNPEGWPGLEVGWKLARHAWGEGFATEAALASIAWAWANLDTERLISVIAPENARSIRVAERLGMRMLRSDSLGGEPVTIYGVDREVDPTPRARTRGRP